jgi:glutathione S-transferase
MIVVHHLNNSRSQRILWLLEELGVEYEVRRHERDSKTNLAPESLKKVHPLGKSPVIIDGELTIAESGVIIDYLAQKYAGDRLVPPAGTPEHLRYTYWLHYAEGSAMTPLLLKLVFDRIDSTPVPFFIRPIVRKITGAVNDAFINPNVKLHLDYIESELGRSEWFVGNQFTAADIQMSFPLEGSQARPDLSQGRPRIQAFVKKVQARPAYQRALERGGPYELGGRG